MTNIEANKLKIITKVSWDIRKDVIKNKPHAMSVIASAELRKRLRLFNISCRLVEGFCYFNKEDLRGSTDTLHVWVLVENTYFVDITLDQFNGLIPILAKPVEILAKQPSFILSLRQCP